MHRIQDADGVDIFPVADLERFQINCCSHEHAVLDHYELGAAVGEWRDINDRCQ